MLGHASLGVSQLDRSLAFYDAVLGAIGAVRVWTSAGAAGYGPVGGNDQLALFLRDPGDRPLAAGAGAHLAFVTFLRYLKYAFSIKNTWRCQQVALRNSTVEAVT